VFAGFNSGYNFLDLVNIDLSTKEFMLEFNRLHRSLSDPCKDQKITKVPGYLDI
jgi:hypothetical protein